MDKTKRLTNNTSDDIDHLENILNQMIRDLLPNNSKNDAVDQLERVNYSENFSLTINFQEQMILRLNSN